MVTGRIVHQFEVICKGRNAHTIRMPDLKQVLLECHANSQGALLLSTGTHTTNTA
jgi:hypothetical protein